MYRLLNRMSELAVAKCVDTNALRARVFNVLSTRHG